MLVVISDTHFEEEASDNVEGVEPFSRNLSSRAYIRFIAHLAEDAKRNRARRLDLVLAGDIFDLHRTSLWFEEPNKDVRPYASSGEMEPELEGKVLGILNKISSEKQVSKTLKVFRDLASGRYRERPKGKTKDFPVEVEIRYIPGNHDRLTNAAPAIRQQVRELLGGEGGREAFPTALRFEDPPVLVRHGHEYDPINFSSDYSDPKGDIPYPLEEHEYDGPTLGDFVTVDLASRLPFLFRRLHPADEIAKAPAHTAVYRRLLEFDDVRPQWALPGFLLSTPPPGQGSLDEGWTTSVRDCLMPILERTLKEIRDHEYLSSWLKRFDTPAPFEPVDFVQAFLDLKPLQPFALRWLFDKGPKIIQDRLTGPGTHGAALFASRERLIRDGEVRSVIAGHTHNPGVALVAADHLGERYYIDTGTWRNSVLATPEGDSFGRLKALTYVVVYSSDEDPGGPEGQEGKRLWSFDYWTGFTRKWSAR